VALHPIVETEQPDALAHVAEGELVLIQLPPVASLDALSAGSTSAVTSPVKPEGAPSGAPALNSEEGDATSHPPVAAQVSLLHCVPPETECKVCQV
jgi:hypothetical protein